MKCYKFKVWLKSDVTPETDKRAVIVITVTTLKIPYEKLEATIMQELNTFKNVLAWECKDLK